MICKSIDDHIPYPNPYKKNNCLRCGKPITCDPQKLAKPVLIVHEHSDPPRNPDQEAQVARDIVGPEVEALLSFAQARARPGPVNGITNGRDLLREAMEELADLFNYCVWGIQQREIKRIDDHGDLFSVYGAALIHAAKAYNHLAWARGSYLDQLRR